MHDLKTIHTYLGCSNSGLAHWIPEAEKERQQGKTDFTNHLINLPDANEPGTWADKYDKRLQEAHSILESYKISSDLIDRYAKASVRNRYHWEIFRVLNDFQVTAPKLLLALKECDTADDTLATGLLNGSE